MLKTFVSGVALVACGVVLGIEIDRGIIPAVSAQQREGTPWTATADDGGAAAGSGARSGAGAVELAHHDGRPVALDQSVVGRARGKTGRSRSTTSTSRAATSSSSMRKNPRSRNPSSIRRTWTSAGHLRRHRHEQPRDGQGRHREEEQRGSSRPDYRTMLESCYACHKSVGRPYLRPQIPTTRCRPW